MKSILALTASLLWFSHLSLAQRTIAFEGASIPVERAITHLKDVCSHQGTSLSRVTPGAPDQGMDIVVIANGKVPRQFSKEPREIHFDTINPEGYQYRMMNSRSTLVIAAVDEVGAMYGVLDLADHITAAGKFEFPPEKVHNPTLAYRIVKFNLPWSPYRDSPATTVHMQVCRDLGYWEKFLDMMVENRFNVLSLWNNHPFPYLIRARNFPRATPFSDEELAEWKVFWTALFRMARERGIQTFLVNWNIVVSPEFAKAYGAKEYNDLSDQVRRYTRESVTRLIDEYPDLTGLGVTLADWMGTFDEKMTPQQREDWIEQTFVAGIKDASREVKFLHRSVLAGDPLAMRRVLDNAHFSQEALVEIKFNWSHGHSTPTLAITHDYHSGKLDERFWTPMPRSYKIQWMIRNEDFFILRWGQPDFVRQHIAANRKPYVNGYFIGSEGYIPAMDYSQRPSAEKTWQYAFEKQWLFYLVWGRLLYDDRTTDEFFEDMFNSRYGKGMGKAMLEAYKLASNVPLRLASFHRSTWDYTLYAEGFIEAEPSSPKGTFDRTSPFISIDEFIDHETLDPNLISIPDFVKVRQADGQVPSGGITPLQLAAITEEEARQTLATVHDLRGKVTMFSGALVSELDDLATWSHMGLYFAQKLRAGVALQEYRMAGKTVQKEEAIRYLQLALAQWDEVVALTQDRYLPTPLVSTQHYGDAFREFSWASLRPQAERDIVIARQSVPMH